MYYIEEFEAAIKKLQNGKAEWTDDVPTELLKAVGQSTKYELFSIM